MEIHVDTRMTPLHVSSLEYNGFLRFTSSANLLTSWWQACQPSFIAGSLEAAYSLNWGAREIWGKGEGRPWHFYDK